MAWTGDYLGDHWLGEKELFHDTVQRVPFIVFDPDPADASYAGDLVGYADLAPRLNELMASSDRVSVQVVGQSTNGRDLYLVTVTAPEKRSETRRQTAYRELIQHEPRKAARDTKLQRDYKAPVWFSANIHGNEWEGTDASLRYIEELATAPWEEVEDLLGADAYASLEERFSRLIARSGLMEGCVDASKVGRRVRKQGDQRDSEVACLAGAVAERPGEQRPAGGPDAGGEALLLGVQLGAQEQCVEPDHPVERRADLVAHPGQELRLLPRRLHGCVARPGHGRSVERHPADAQNRSLVYCQFSEHWHCRLPAGRIGLKCLYQRDELRNE